ncbi:MAG: biotin transporter BioY [Candidatus Omnitrophota bacterium]|nr:MAG: biotin transporter BioY [Candidatus Omnitrophota bacterium]
MKAILQSRKVVLAKDAFLVCAFALFMVVCANVRIHLFFTPVPITLQTFVVYVSIVALRKQAPFSQIIYILLGMAGIPVFSNGGAGLIYLFGPTGGYILGFLVAAFMFGYLLPEKLTFRKVLFTFLSASVVIYFFGVSWLVFLHKFSLSGAIIAGVLPFVIGEIFKIVLATFLSLKTFR